MKKNDLVVYQKSETSIKITPSEPGIFEDYFDNALQQLKERDCLFYPTIDAVIEELENLTFEAEISGILDYWEDPDLDIPEEECRNCSSFELDKGINADELYVHKKSFCCAYQYDSGKCPFRKVLFKIYIDFLNNELLNEEFMAKYFYQEKIPFLDNKKGIVNNPQLSLWE